MSRFVPNPRAQREVDAKVRPYVREFGEAVQQQARKNLRDANIGDSGQLSATIGINYGVGGLSLIVGADRQRGPQNADVGLIIHEGHKEIYPQRKPILIFKPKGAKRFVFAQEVRAVGGVQFLTDAMRQVNDLLPSDRRFKLTFNTHPVNAPKPHEVPFVPRGARR